MSVAQDNEIFEKYLSDMQCLAVAEKRDAILRKIEEEAAAFSFSDAALFFKAEKSFHNREYEKALGEYLQARQAPYYDFFCYRATAFVSHLKGDDRKAMAFLEKSLQIRPNDFIALKLCRDIYEKERREDLVKEIDTKIASLRTAFSETEELREEKEVETDVFIARHLGVDIELEKELEERSRFFKESSRNAVERYLRFPRKKEDMLLRSFSGFAEDREGGISLPGQFPQTVYGLFIKWRGRGIVINPGTSFLRNFHAAGFSILDIDHVIASRFDAVAYSDIREIHRLNYRVNLVNSEVHVINYWLNQGIFRALSGCLKPNFKQERNSLHPLELFLDSPDVEKEELERGILLNYFSVTSGVDSRESSKTPSLGVKLELMDGERSLNLGFISGTPWSPTIANNMGRCAILIAGFGSTDSNDYGKLNYREECLGYYGIYTLLEEARPKMLLIADFEEKEGEYRLEIIRKLRKEFNNFRGGDSASVILPLDIDFALDLKNLRVKCSISDKYLKPEEIKVVKSRESFGSLLYLAPKWII